MFIRLADEQFLQFWKVNKFCATYCNYLVVTLVG
jgi:hypothetical protein